MFEHFNGKVIWSADNMSLNEILRMVSDDGFPRDKLAVKLDRLFLTRYGLDSIARVQDYNVPVFADAKIDEIPSKALELVKIHLEHRPWMLNVMGSICNNENPESDVLSQFSGLCEEVGTKSCVVTVLTSKSPKLAGIEFNQDIADAALFYAKHAINCGATDIVCSPQETSYVSRINSVFDINTPGVRFNDSPHDDQARTTSPQKAIELGATRLVIGRDLTRNSQFSENLNRVLREIERAII